MHDRKKPLILLTNDDGFYSKGIETLFDCLKDLGQVYIVAPDQEKSATSLALNLYRPLRVKLIKEGVYAVDGTPADCVYLAVQKLLPKKPDLLISGINHGPNLGQQDISYSGTVAGGIQGTFLQIQSVAVSLLRNSKDEFEFAHAARFVHHLAENLLKKRLPEGITLNINIPAPPVKGIRIAKLGQKRYNPEIIEKKDPRRKVYYWIGTGTPKAIGDKDSDVMVIKKGFITVTPLHTDLTDYQTIDLQDFQMLFSSLADELS